MEWFRDFGHVGGEHVGGEHVGGEQAGGISLRRLLILAIVSLIWFSLVLSFAGHALRVAPASGLDPGTAVLGSVLLLGAMLSCQIGNRSVDRARLSQCQAQLLEAEAAEAEWRCRLELAEQIAHVGSWRLSLPDGAVFCSDEMCRILGKPRPDTAPTFQDIVDVLHPVDRRRLTRVITLAASRAGTAGNAFEICLRVLRPSGELRHVLTRGAAQFGPEGRISGFSGASIDISEQRVVESRLRHAQAETSAVRRALEAIVLQDGLTGLANRRQFDQALNHEFRRAVRTRTTLALILVDVDAFKSFNDRYGHPSGDACLRAIASTLAALANRPGDLVARYGGEEIAILLPGNDVCGTRAVAEAAAQAVRDLRIAHAGAEAGIVTVSVGFEAFEPAHRHDLAGELVQRADIALYAAKRDGRNAVRWYGEIQPYETGAVSG